METAKFKRTKAFVYTNGKIGIDRFGTMKEATDIIKKLLKPNTVKGIALFVGDKYQETIAIGGLI